MGSSVLQECIYEHLLLSQLPPELYYHVQASIFRTEVAGSFDTKHYTNML